MSPNGDNAMARFLFAILKQKNLKDIDWNQVAEDPVLLQPISNGHAARMRYSRFRATVTGHEPQKRSRHGNKDRVSKSSKSNNAAQITSQKISASVKSEPGSKLSSLAQYSPVSLSSPYVGDQDDCRARFLTPCSEIVTHTVPAEAPAVPKEEHINSDIFVSLMGGNYDIFADPGGMMNTSAFSAFDTAYNLSNYNTKPTEIQSPDLTDPSGHQSPIDCAQDWNDRLHDCQLF